MCSFGSKADQIFSPATHSFYQLICSFSTRGTVSSAVQHWFGFAQSLMEEVYGIVSWIRAKQPRNTCYKTSIMEIVFP